MNAPMKNHGGNNDYFAIVMGASAGGQEVWHRIFTALPAEYPLPIIAVQHMHPSADVLFVRNSSNRYAVTIKEAEDKAPILPGHVYFAPANYHLLVEQAGTFALSTDPRVNYSRPSIDVLFESAAWAWGASVIGILFTGASNDGAKGLLEIKKQGGLTIAQDPAEAAHPVMPQSALDLGAAQRVMTLEKIVEFLLLLPAQIVKEIQTDE
jgi:two-component system chemotaxis response regulator CheB